ncbi:MAG: hypothetical protein K5853_02385 [Lachnospiraceae bacterium]|nr:hypothetical protein [Lachnospiraceae bacterium]
MVFMDITAENIKFFLPNADQWIKDNISRGRFFAIGVEDNESAAGAIVYTVRTGDNGEGNIGVLYHLSGEADVMKSLLEEYALRCDGLDINYTIIETSDEKLKDFLADYGFDMEEGESITLEFTVADLDNIEAFKSVKIPASIQPLSQTSPIEFRYFLQEYRERVDLNPLFDIEVTPMGWYDNDASCISVNEEGIDAAFLVHFDGKNTVTAELLAGFKADFVKKIPYLLACSVQYALLSYTPKTKVIVRRTGKNIAKITDSILKGMKGKKAYHGILDTLMPANHR